ncbi:MAG: motility protein A, partial [Planctomycetota bacterium]|nr:motility protein A [Planctomycetota bacterium]
GPRLEDLRVDIATIIGLILGVLVIVGAVLLGGTIAMFIDPTSVVVVGLGSVAALLIAFPLKNIVRLPGVTMKTLFAKPADHKALIKTMVGLAEIARRDGILSLENHVAEMDDKFIVQGIQMAVDGTDPELIQQILEQDLENQLTRHDTARSLYASLGRYAPAFGMIGTLIGLVAMLANMSDPSNIGAGMAVALLTTLYGAVLANVFFLPLADKLALRSAEEALVKEIIIKGVMSIQAGDNPRVVEQKLCTFLPAAARSKGEEEGEELRQAA